MGPSLLSGAGKKYRPVESEIFEISRLSVGSEIFPLLSEITTGNWNCLGGLEFPWRPKSNRQGNDSFLGGATSHSRKHIFLGGQSKPPRNMEVSLAVSSNLQGNDLFPWVLF
jgi:hypothetical protein